MLEEYKPNNRIEIEYEADNPESRIVRGIVLDVSDHSILIITNYGEMIEIPEGMILSISQISFNRGVSEALNNLKHHYSEMHELRTKQQALEEDTQGLIDELYDANFLAKFNIYGARTRLEATLPASLLSFRRDDYAYEVELEAQGDNHIVLKLTAFNSFEYYNLSDIHQQEKIKRVHAPDIYDWITKAFPIASKVEEVEKKIIHDKESLYHATTLYRMYIPIEEKDFLEKRDAIHKGLTKLAGQSYKGAK